MAKREIPARCCNCLRHSNNLHTGAKQTPKGVVLTFQMCGQCRSLLVLQGVKMHLKPQQEVAHA